MVVTVLGFSSFCFTLASLPSWAAGGGASAGSAGLVTTTMLTATVLVQTTVPWLLQRFGTGATFAAGLLALGAPAPLLALSDQLGPLLVISFVRGAGFAVLTVVGAGLTAGVAPADRRGEAVGLYGLAIAVPNMLAVPAGVALTQHGGFGWVGGLSALPVLAVPMALSLGREMDLAGQASDGPGSHGSVLPALLAPSLVLLGVTLAGGGLVTFLPLARPTGALATTALLVFGLVAAVSRWRVGMLADRVGAGRLLPLLVVVAVAGMCVVTAGLHWSSGPALISGAVLFGAGYGAVQNLTLLVAFARAGPARTAKASSVWNAAFDAGTGTGAGAVGAVSAAGLGLNGAFLVTAGLMLLTLPLTRDRGPDRHRPT
jgi:predicted MFS family arabinose efflux permease